MKHALRLLVILVFLIAACGDDNETAPTSDTTPPARVEDLAVQDSAGGRITLVWTAPGDDAMEGQAARYDIRCSMNSLSEAEWTAATVIDSLLVPGAASAAESLTVSGLAEGLWHFGLKTVDDATNWSSLSNVVSATVIDTIPPARVIDLAAVFATTTSVELAWTAPGDDGDEGKAVEYDLRYALAPITEEAWDEALRAESVPAPDSAGSPESYTVSGLELGTAYSFALKVVDDALNVSELSNSVDRSTLNVVRLTYSPGKYGVRGRAAWSPNGQSIVFPADWYSIEYWQPSLILIPASGGETVQLTFDPDAYCPSWSPDGTRIAFVSSFVGHYGLYGIWIMDAIPGAERLELITTPDAAIWECTWSPEGSRIAYVTARGSPMPICDIWVMPSEGGTPRTLAAGWEGRALAWSPDGTRIAFYCDRSGNNEVWVIPASGGTAVQLTHDPASDTCPTWSPDGNQIAFLSNRTGDMNLWLMSSAGENPIQLTNDPAHKWGTTWSPDGSRIAYNSTAGEITDVWILELE